MVALPTAKTVKIMYRENFRVYGICFSITFYSIQCPRLNFASCEDIA